MGSATPYFIPAPGEMQSGLNELQESLAGEEWSHDPDLYSQKLHSMYRQPFDVI